MAGSKWTKEEMGVLTTRYANLKFGQLCLLLPNRTPQSIRMQASNLGLKMQYPANVWTEHEEKLLVHNYRDMETTQICALFKDRSYDSIKLHAAKLGLKRRYLALRLSDLSILLKDTPETYYWLGFAFADGHFSKRGRLKVILAIKDMGHLEKLSQYLYGYNNVKHNTTQCWIQPVDSESMLALASKFNIKSDKTREPCDINIADNDLFVAFLCGYIDGDGCISYQYKRKDFVMRIKVHATWFKNLIYISHRLSIISGHPVKLPKINTQGYATLLIGKMETIRGLKRKAIELKLPILNRKWDKVNLNSGN